jgi:hypothetical protein
MEDIFVRAVKMLKAKGYMKVENYLVDGTKIESARGRYRFVWKQSVEKDERKLEEKLRGRMRTGNTGSGTLRSGEARRGIPVRR